MSPSLYVYSPLFWFGVQVSKIWIKVSNFLIIHYFVLFPRFLSPVTSWCSHWNGHEVRTPWTEQILFCPVEAKNLLVNNDMNSPPATSTLSGSSSNLSSAELGGKGTNEGGLPSPAANFLFQYPYLSYRKATPFASKVWPKRQWIDDFLNSTRDIGSCELRYGIVRVREMTDCKHIVIHHYLLCLFSRARFYRKGNGWKGLHGFI